MFGDQVSSSDWVDYLEKCNLHLDEKSFRLKGEKTFGAFFTVPL